MALWLLLAASALGRLQDRAAKSSVDDESGKVRLTHMKETEVSEAAFSDHLLADAMRDDKAGAALRLAGWNGSTHGPEGRIVLLPGKGCSGTTFIWAMARDLLEAHGERNIWPCSHGKEFLHGKPACLKDSYCTGENGEKIYWPADPVERLEAAQNLLQGKSPCKDGRAALEAHSRTKADAGDSFVMLVNGNAPDDVQAAAVEFVAKDPRNGVAGTVRSNTWRTEVCKATDFPDDHAGYQVFENGTKSDMGVHRRSSKEKIMVKLYAEKIKAKLLNPRKYPSDDLAKVLTKHGYSADFVTYEDLAAYEFDAADMPRSLKAWTTLLTRAGVKVKPELVKAALRPGAGTRTEKPLKDVIYNYEEIRSMVTDSQTPLTGARKSEFLHMLEASS